LLVGNLGVRLLAGVLFILVLAFRGGAQAPSTEEQRYLFSALPLIDSGELSKAEEQLLGGIERYPRSAILYNALGIVYRNENQFDQAAGAFRKALEILPSFTAAQLQLAAIHQRQGRKEPAAELFRAAGESTTNFDALMTAGQGLADCEDYAGAARVLQKAHATRPDSGPAAYNLALAQYKSGDFTSALKTIESITSGEPDVLYLRGKILEGLGRPQEADKVAACRMQPGVEAFCADAALDAIRQEKFLDAVALLEPAVEKSPGSHALLSLLGLAQFRLGRYRDAIRSYSAALHSDATLDASREGLGFLYYVTGDLEKARSVVEDGLRSPKADFYLAHLEAMILYRLSPQLRTKSAQAVERAIQLNSRFAPSYFLRGKIRLDQNDSAGALADFERAVELDPKYPLPYYKMAQIYARQGRAQQSEAARRKFSELGNLREEEILARQTQDVLMPAAR
jgi:tetratricopeptide (TPR) repeat protein